MATIKYVIFEHHIKSDGTVNVKFRITHRGKQVYYKSPFTLHVKQLRKDYTIKDQTELGKINKAIDVLWGRISDLGMDADGMSAKEILQYITKPQKAVNIDFIKFCTNYLSKLVEDGKLGTYRAMRSPVNHLIDFTDGAIDVNSLTTQFLKQFELFLKESRTYSRANHSSKVVKINSKGLDRSGIFKVMTNIRTLFNHCRKEYNSFGNIVVKSNPFEYYDIPVPVKARKKGSDLSVADIIDLRDAELTGRAELGRDIFMLSFYMCGLNMIELYNGGWEINKGRFEYNRSKVKDRRSDAGFISINIPEVAKPLLKKYTSDYLRKRYSSYEGFNKAVNIGLGKITFYHARHTFATLASKEFGYSDNEIGFALNHASGTSVTSKYIATDWTRIDRIQSDVLSLLSGDEPVKV